MAKRWSLTDSLRDSLRRARGNLHAVGRRIQQVITKTEDVEELSEIHTRVEELRLRLFREAGEIDQLIEATRKVQRPERVEDIVNDLLKESEHG